MSIYHLSHCLVWDFLRHFQSRGRVRRPVTSKCIAYLIWLDLYDTMCKRAIKKLTDSQLGLPREI